ncbi:MAG: metallophosphoesterase [Clostridia bacterium]|nr:metallophosphoesterase [Clostridia bacterium]
MLKVNPTVFAVNKNYQIIVSAESESFCSVRVGEREFFSESNGMARLALVHKIDVPQSLLDSVGEYTVLIRPVTLRKGYGAETAEPMIYKYPFYAVPTGDIRAYNISDAHSLVNEPIAAAKAFGKIDLLILCGDVMNDCHTPESFENVYKICSAITCGSIPVVSARGNHDMRGRLADRFADYMPAADGKIFFTFTLGSLWGVVLDCGEITPDSNPEHGFTVCCDNFRREQTEFLKRIVENKETEYAAEGVKRKIVVVHDPFFEKHNPPYDVTRDIFREWFEVINPNIDPDFWLCGHSHLCEVRRPPYHIDEFGIKAPLVMASTNGKEFFRGGGFEFKDDGIYLTFTDNVGNRSDSIKI